MSFLDTLDTSILDEFLPQERGGKPKPSLVTCTITGLVEPDTLASYCAKVQRGELLPGGEGNGGFDLQKLTSRHHSVARLLASGVPEGVVATISHFSAPYVSRLKDSPAMQDLIAHYRGPGNEAASILAEKLRVLGDASTDELLRRVVEEPEELTAADLTAIAKLGHDRSGLGPSSRVDVNKTSHVVDHARLEALRRSSRAAETERILTPERRQLPPPRDQDAA